MPGKQDHPVKVSCTGCRMDRSIENKEGLSDKSKNQQNYQTGCYENEGRQTDHDKTALGIIGMRTGGIGHTVLESEADFSVRIEHLEENTVYQFMYDDEYKVDHEKECKRDQKAGQIIHAEAIAEITASQKYTRDGGEQHDKEEEQRDNGHVYPEDQFFVIHQVVVFKQGHDEFHLSIIILLSSN